MVFGGSLGSHFLGHGRCRFRVWAPNARSVELHVVAPREEMIPLEGRERGYFETIVNRAAPGWRYYYRLDGGAEWPDPASRCQPEGVHGPSQVIDPQFEWHDQDWHAPPLDRYVIYELHTGTFSPEGTFEGIIPHLDHLRDLGITAIELMPIAQFPGGRNWGYDGAYPFAAQNSYGGLDGLRRLVDACHGQGLAVVLDVVYNHMGPEGNYFRKYSVDYFTGRYKTPWGDAINFDGPGSDEVRNLFIENALYWVGECHIDALRLDAIHAIKDFSAMPFLEQLGEKVQELARREGRTIEVIAESDLNDARVIQPRELGGLGLDAQWSDDFHHAVHALLTGERLGYYEDFGEPWQLARALTKGYVYTGEYSSFRGCSHGRPTDGIAGQRFVVCAQNHDQIGNRMLGERLSALAPGAARLAAGLVLLSPFVPLLFMGEEYGETAPFQYFTSHSDAELVAAVRKGRAEEFASFAWRGDVPDPHSEATFEQSKLNHALRRKAPHRELLEYYRTLLALRRRVPALASLDRERMEVIVGPAAQPGRAALAGTDGGGEVDRHENANGHVMMMRRWAEGSEAVVLFNLGGDAAAAEIALPEGRWRKMLDSAATGKKKGAGDGGASEEIDAQRTAITMNLAPFSVTVYGRGELMEEKTTWNY